jgi:hypothetical protein
MGQRNNRQFDIATRGPLSPTLEATHVYLRVPVTRGRIWSIVSLMALNATMKSRICLEGKTHSIAELVLFKNQGRVTYLRRQIEMASKVRKIDPKGLHELANSEHGQARPDGSFGFQLEFAKEQAKDILLNLPNLVKNTIDKAPMREGDFHVNRTTSLQLGRKKVKHYEEHKWERAMYEKWGPKGAGEYVPVCKGIQAYQYPLQGSFRDRYWGKIDLLGIGADFLPVPNELKKPKTNESPLRMLVEVAAYGFAIRRVWPNLKAQWVKAVHRFGASPSEFPETLDDVKVALVGVAPEEYWCRCLGLLPSTKEGKFPSEAWPPFWDLVDAFGTWFDIHFVAVEGSWDDTAGVPIITGARLLDLRRLTPNPAADAPDHELARAGRDALMEAYQRTVHHSPSFRR